MKNHGGVDRAKVGAGIAATGLVAILAALGVTTLGAGKNVDAVRRAASVADGLPAQTGGVGQSVPGAVGAPAAAPKAPAVGGTAGGGAAALPAPATMPLRVGGAVACGVIYEVETQWPAGGHQAFLGDIQVVNVTAQALTTWTLTWSFPGTQKIYQSWGADFAQQGAGISAASEPREGFIAANAGKFHMGFLANVAGINSMPTDFTLNGKPCPVVNDQLQPVATSTAQTAPTSPSASTGTAAAAAPTAVASAAPVPMLPVVQPATAGAGTCKAIYEIESQWPANGKQAFQGDIQVINTTAKDMTTWTLSWSFGGDQKIYQSWGADFRQTGATVAAASEPNEGFIRANGGAFHMGFLAAVGSSNPKPTAFTLNGMPCPIVEG